MGPPANGASASDADAGAYGPHARLRFDNIKQAWPASRIDVAAAFRMFRAVGHGPLADTTEALWRVLLASGGDVPWLSEALKMIAREGFQRRRSGRQ
jgi:hypothetical protein